MTTLVKFQDHNSRQIIKELNLSIIPPAEAIVKIGAMAYRVESIALDTDKVEYIISLRPLWKISPKKRLNEK